jgi:hypothetical protein
VFSGCGLTPRPCGQTWRPPVHFPWAPTTKGDAIAEIRALELKFTTSAASTAAVTVYMAAVAVPTSAVVCGSHENPPPLPLPRRRRSFTHGNKAFAFRAKFIDALRWVPSCCFRRILICSSFLPRAYWGQGFRLLPTQIWPRYVISSLKGERPKIRTTCVAPAALTAAAWSSPLPLVAVLLNKAAAGNLNIPNQPFSWLSKNQFRDNLL